MCVGGILISVIKSQRSVSYVEFLKVTSELCTEVMNWARNQSVKDKEFGVTGLYQSAASAFENAFLGNQHYPNSVDEISARKALFQEAIRQLLCFNAKLTILSKNIQVSNKKKKRWSLYSQRAIELLTAVIQSDRKRKIKQTEDIIN